MDADDDLGGGGLSFGIASWHLRMLAECGCSYGEIGEMSPDQVCHRICDSKVLKSRGGVRVGSAHPLAVRPDGQGLVKGRAEDGTPIMAKMNVGGKSLTRRLMEEEEAKAREAAKR